MAFNFNSLHETETYIISQKRKTPKSSSPDNSEG